jgi:hypothetical protein
MNYFLTFTAAGFMAISVMAHAQSKNSSAPARSQQQQIEDEKQKAANKRVKECLDSASRSGQKDGTPEFRRSVFGCMKR